MHANKIYTGIGSRETPRDVLYLMVKIGFRMAEYGWTLRSGHAEGADQAFENGVRMAQETGAQGGAEIYLPWDGFEGAKHNGRTYFSQFPEEIEAKARHAAAKIHPNWAACSDGARKMHTRNMYQILGRDLNTNSDMVICWTRGGQMVGGTIQALRLAKYLKIPIFNLAICTQQQILNFVNHGELPR